MLLVAARCERTAGAEWVVIGLTRGSVKRIYWGPLKKLNETLELGIAFNDQELIAKFPNGSRIYFVGGETSAEIEKLRGGRYHGAVVDECASYGALVFQALIDEILQPALNRYRGTMYLIGTPGDILAGPFYLATCQPAEVLDTPLGKRTTNRLFGDKSGAPEAKWSLHVWTLQDNTACPWLWDDALKLKIQNGWSDDHPIWQREYLGRWVASSTRLVYRYAPHRHDYTPQETGRFGLAEGHDWRTVCGVDLGTRDGCAIVVWAYSPTHQGLWEVFSGVKRTEKGDRYPLGDFVAWYRAVESQYGPYEGSVADTASLATMVVEKLDHIELFNADLDRRLIRVLVGSELSAELQTDRWDEKLLARGKREEDRAVPNDTADAALYAFRWCNHRRAQEREKVVALGSPAWWVAQRKAELDALKDAARRRADPEQMQLDRDNWWETN
jgi:hypothetical protein